MGRGCGKGLGKKKGKGKGKKVCLASLSSSSILPLFLTCLVFLCVFFFWRGWFCNYTGCQTGQPRSSTIPIHMSQLTPEKEPLQLAKAGKSILHSSFLSSLLTTTNILCGLVTTPNCSHSHGVHGFACLRHTRTRSTGNAFRFIVFIYISMSTCKKKSKGKKGKKGKKGSGKGGEAPEKVKLQWPWFNKLSQWMGPTDKTRVPLRRQFRFTYLDRRANFPLCEYDRKIESRLDYLCLVLCAICVMCNV